MKSGFLWGAAASAHQVEGYNIHNDWWAWEQSLPANKRSGRAADHYHRFAADFALARALGHNAHRLSLEWSRIEPSPGHFNERAIEHYRQVLEELKKQKLTSFVTLHHFTNPVWFARAGGWEAGGAARAFARYVRVVAERLGDLVDYWVTINEPMVYAVESYRKGTWPPQSKNFLSLWRVIDNLASAHRQAYRVIHRQFPGAKVGLAQSVVAFKPNNPHSLFDALAVDVCDWWYNHRFIRRTAGTHDFIGLNYYFSAVRPAPAPAEALAKAGPTTDLNWPIDPDGLTQALLDFKQYQLPIYITENGLADAADSRRADFIRSHLRAIEVAQTQGADVRGYFHWSLLDNFEWAEGFTPRFGLVKINYDTLERTPRPSAYVYKAIIEQAKL